MPTSSLAVLRLPRRAGLLALPLLLAAPALVAAPAEAQVNVTAGVSAPPPASAPPPVMPAPAAQGGYPPPAQAWPAPPQVYVAPPGAPPPPGWMGAPPSAVVAAPPPPAPPPLTPEQAERKEWEERDTLAGEASALTGGTGLLHLQHAQGAAPGQLRVGFTAEYFASGFLCTSAFPCPNPQGGAAVTHDKLSHYGGTLNLDVGITRWLEAYLSTSAVSNSDSQNRPQLLQVIGDSNLGAKAYFSPGRAFYLGLAAELWLINGTGAVGVDGGSTSAKFRALSTLDLRELDGHAPLRFSLNVGYSLDNGGASIRDVELQRNASITRIERFGVAVNRVDHFDFALGAELLVADERLRPFVEYGLLAPVNRQGYECHGLNANGDNCLASDTVLPSKLTVGARFLPWKRGLSIIAAGDIGVTGVKDFIEELTPVAPWTLYLGASLTTDLVDRPSDLTHHRFHPGGHVRGFVHEIGKTDGIADAIVSFDGRPELTSLATSPEGKFATLGLPEGNWGFTVRADGYKPGICMASLVRAPALSSDGHEMPNPAGEVQDAVVDCGLEALPRVGTLLGHLRDSESNASVPNARVKVSDSQGKELSLVSDASGSFRAEGVASGVANVGAQANGYFDAVATLDLKPRTDNPLEIGIVHRPKNPQVQVTAKEITIQQQVQFATDSAVILPESNGLLSEIADVFQKTLRIKKVEIQGHTDSDGSDAHNQVLSEDRANAVRNWLIAHGVSGDRVTAQGYGSKKPLVPNVTAGNKAKNRRVQFIILDQDPANGAGQGSGTRAPSTGAPAPSAH